MEKLKSALSSVDWNKNAKSFLVDESVVKRCFDANHRSAIWSKQIEQVDAGNPALSFIRELQISSTQAVALTSIGMYRPAAASIRGMIEAALYYIYYRSHPAELATLIRSPGWYIDKAGVVDWLKVHSPFFLDYQAKLGVLSRLSETYSALSVVIHGQLPGAWNSVSSLQAIARNEEIEKEVVQRLELAEEVVHRLFLCVFGPLCWVDISAQAKRILLKGLDADIRAFMKLDLA